MFSVHAKKGFALPTVLIASFVMLSVLTVILSSTVSGVVAALDSSHYGKYAQTASQSGLVMAKACLRANNYTATWTVNPLKPNTNCSGVVQGGLSVYTHDDTSENIRATFTVAPPTTLANGVQRITVSSTVERMRKSTNTVWKTYTSSSYATISAQTSFSSVAFGYQTGGAFFGVIDPQGVVTSVGYNGDGQLGNGTTSNTATPKTFQLPGVLRASQLFTSFLSVGFNMFAITTDGQLYGSGLNSSGQLGNGAMTAAQSTPVKFLLPAGVTAKYVAQGMSFTYVIGSDNNVYSAGSCSNGTLGYSYTIAGCTNQSTYKRVALPTVNLGDTNTLPVATSDWVQSTNITTDRWNGYVRMQGGKVYGWGINDNGQLGNGTTTSSDVPVQITALGNAAQPKATQLAFDGDSIWILDNNGDVWAAGKNMFGELGTASPVGSTSGKCIDNPGNSTSNGQKLQINACSNAVSQMIEWAEDGTLRFKPNTSTVKCINNTGGVPQLAVCSAATTMKWTMNDAGKIVNPASGQCIENPANSATNGTQLAMVACNATAGYAAQTWTLKDVLTPAKVVLPAGQGTVTRITTDQWSVLFMMSNGTVWGYGLNLAGQLGSGTLDRYNPEVRKLILPAGRTATNFYTTKRGTDIDLTAGNTFVVLDDGSVYGTGANTFGQLGNGTTSGTPVSTPVMMTLPAGVRAQSVQTGLGTTVVLTDEGKIYTVGNNANGQLGDGTTTNSSIPQAREYVNNRPVLLY